MKKEVFNSLRKEMQYIGLMFLLAMLIFKIVFFNENLVVLLRTILSLFWLFVLPGYCVLLYWKDKLEFIERLIIGVIISAGIIGVFSYHIGLIGLNVKYHTFLLPLAIILIGLILGKNQLFLKKS